LRREEATAIRWSNVKGDHIEIPDTKNDIPHFVPITGSLKGILRSQRYQWEILKLSDAWRPQMDDWVFPAFSVSGHMTEPKSQVAKIAKATNTSFSVHDLRRTFSTHAMIAGVDYHKLKKAMNHKSQDITQQYVQASLQLVRPVFEAVERQFLLYHDSEAMLEAEHPELFEV
jgi:integrase